MSRKIVFLFAAAVALAPMSAGAQSGGALPPPGTALPSSPGSGPNQSSCQPMIQDAQARLNQVSDDWVRGQIMNTLDQARLELRQRDYDACVNTVQVALNEIDRHGGPVPEAPFQDRDRDGIPDRLEPDQTPEPPAVPAPMERRPGY